MTRKTVRERLVSLFTTNGSFTQVNGYVPIDLKGTSKVLNIYAGGSKPDFISGSMTNEFHVFNLDVLVRRGGTNDTSEDDLDTLQAAVESVIKANIGDSNWSHMEFDGQSECFHAEISGTKYRGERHRLKVKVTS